jgi:hypothetical protein
LNDSTNERFTLPFALLSQLREFGSLLCAKPWKLLCEGLGGLSGRQGLTDSTAACSCSGVECGLGLPCTLFLLQIFPHFSASSLSREKGS